MGHPAFESGSIDIHNEHNAVVHRDSKRLGAAHAASTSRESDCAGQGAAEPLVCNGREGLKGALEYALGADVDP